MKIYMKRTYRVSAELNFSLQPVHRHWRESSDAAALDWEVAVVAVEGAGVVPLELELSPPDWIEFSGAADMAPTSRFNRSKIGGIIGVNARDYDT